MRRAKKLGEILVDLQVLTPGEVEGVLEALRFRYGRQKFGQMARDMGLVQEGHILAALAVQMDLFPGIDRMSLGQILSSLQDPKPETPTASAARMCSSRSNPIVWAIWPNFCRSRRRDRASSTRFTSLLFKTPRPTRISPIFRCARGIPGPFSVPRRREAGGKVMRRVSVPGGSRGDGPERRVGGSPLPQV